MSAEVVGDRHASGSLRKTCRNCGQRREKRWNGKPWYARYGEKKRLNLDPLYRAYWFYTELLASGKDLMDLPVGPEQQERAKRQLRARRRRS